MATACNLSSLREIQYEEKEEYFRSEITCYAAEFQRLQIDKEMYEERESHLLSEIARLVSKNQITEAEMIGHKEKEEKLQQRVIELETTNSKVDEDLRLAVEDKLAIEKSFRLLMEEKPSIEKEPNQFEDESKELVLLLTQKCLESFKRNGELNAKMCTLERNHSTVVSEMNALRKDINTISAKVLQDCLLELLEENKELEERLSILIEQNPSIQNDLDGSKQAMEEEQKTKLVNECEKLKEMNDELNVKMGFLKEAYEGVVHEKDALQADNDFLWRDLADWEEEGGRMSSLVAELKRSNEELLHQITAMRVEGYKGYGHSLEEYLCKWKNRRGRNESYCTNFYG